MDGWIRVDGVITMNGEIWMDLQMEQDGWMDGWMDGWADPDDWIDQDR